MRPAVWISTVLGILIVLAQCPVQALPAFHTVNDHDLHGNVCPLKSRKGLTCPTLCVADHSLCPPSLAPVCPTGQTFCNDGVCHESCEGITNACSCGDDSTPASFVPCLAGQVIDIVHFDPVNQLVQIRQECALNASVANASSVGVWPEFDHDRIWLECPVPPAPTFTYREPMWIAVWALMSAEAAILVAWHLYKSAREAPFHRTMSYNQKKPQGIDEKGAALDVVAKEKSKDANASEVSSLDESEKLIFRGFKNDPFGMVGLGSVVVTTLLFIIFMGCLVSDNYGSLSSDPDSFVFLDSILVSKIFCAVWHIAAAWLAGILFFRKRLRNYFRIESFPNRCPYIQVERRQEETVFLADGSKLVEKLREIEQRTIKRLNMDILVETCKVHENATKSLRYFEYQCMRYVYNEEKHKFEPYEFDLGTSHRQLHEYGKGITQSEADYRQGLVGQNLIKVHVPSIPMAIAQEFSSFLYLYQMMCMWVWYYFQYFQMGLVQTCIILAAAFIRVILRLRAEHRTKSMAEYVHQVSVLRDGEWKSDVSTVDLVPGDVFELQEHTQVPCDAVVLSGTVIVNESSLTGEAMPIRKIALPNDDGQYDASGAGKINTLYAGTTISQVTPALDGDGRVYALALRTGIASEKGMLIHKILYPSPVSFIFNEHLKIAISILLLWGGIAFALTLYLMGRGDITSWYYGVFILSEIFSPLLPAAFTINQSVCAARLRSKKILCIELPRINLSGKVRIFCFDKTGTLTREGLEFYGAVPKPASAEVPFGDRQEDPLTMEPTLARGIATCHAVTKVHDQFIGNPVDIESFNAMKWQLLQPTQAAYLDTLIPVAATPNEKVSPVHIIRRFEFVHARASQSVAVLDEATQQVHVYLKGSFERVRQLSNPASIPASYDETAAKYAQEGCYVLSVAHRKLGVLGEDITMEQVKTMSRDQLEQGCDFVGFILFRNMLKHDTTDAITQLKEGDTRVVMITGDTALTGVFIARQCGMIEPDQRVLLADQVNGTVVWHDVDSGEPVDVDVVLQMDPNEEHKKNVELVMTGRAFEALAVQNRIRKYLLHTRVFARMTPSNKVHCVRLHMEKGVTAMCGDGGNDCGALRAAHVGIALSEAEASIVSPFSTSNRSIMQCVELLKQGRSALATSFANYKFLIFYGECMACWELIMFYFTVIGTQPVWITIDGFITTTMTFAITQARPAAKLGPSRPTAKPVGPYTLASCLGVIFINFWFIVASVIWLFQQDWFVCSEFDSSAVDAARWWLLGDNYEAEMVSLVIMFQFFNNGAVVNFGSVFRQSWWRNYVLVFIWTCFFVSTSFLTLADPNPYSCMYRINCGTASVLHNELGYPMPTWNIEDYNSSLGHNVFPKEFRWKLWGFAVANCLATVIYERVIILGFVRTWAIKRKTQKPQKGRILFKL